MSHDLHVEMFNNITVKRFDTFGGRIVGQPESVYGRKAVIDFRAHGTHVCGILVDIVYESVSKKPGVIRYERVGVVTERHGIVRPFVSHITDLVPRLVVERGLHIHSVRFGLFALRRI